MSRRRAFSFEAGVGDEDPEEQASLLPTAFFAGDLDVLFLVPLFFFLLLTSLRAPEVSLILFRPAPLRRL